MTRRNTLRVNFITRASSNFRTTAIWQKKITNELAREETKETAIFHEAVDIFLYVLTYFDSQRCWRNFPCCIRNVVENDVENPRGGGGVLPEILGLGRDVRPTSKNPYPIYDQNLRYSLPYLWPNQNFQTLFMTWTLHQNPVSDLRYNWIPNLHQEPITRSLQLW